MTRNGDGPGAGTRMVESWWPPASSPRRLPADTGLALALVAAGAALAVALEPLTETPSLAPLLVAVALSAWVGGLVPGLAATLLTALAAAFVVFPPRFDLGLDEGEAWRSALVVVLGLVVSALGERARRARRRVEREAARAQEAEALLASVLEVAPVGFALLDGDLRYARINPVLAALNGAGVAAHLGRTPEEMMSAPHGGTVMGLVREVQRTGRPTVGAQLSGRPPGWDEEGTFLVNYYPVQVRPRPARPWVGVTVVDVSEQRRLLEEQRRVAGALQRALAPPELPAVPGLEVATAYVPLGAGNEVGGDFYDLFRLGDGSVLALIGDVCGKGPEAGALGALTRQTARAVSVGAPGPAGMLRRVNAGLVRQRGLDTQFVTMLLTRLTPLGDRLVVQLSCAGHPPGLLLRRDGTVQALGGPGMPLGLFPEIRVRDHQAELGPGDALVLYTDGVTEAGDVGSRMEQDGLVRLLAHHPGAPARRLVQVMSDAAAALGGESPRDDLAVLVVRVPEREAGDVVAEDAAAPAQDDMPAAARRGGRPGLHGER